GLTRTDIKQEQEVRHGSNRCERYGVQRAQTGELANDDRPFGAHAGRSREGHKIARMSASGTRSRRPFGIAIWRLVAWYRRSSAPISSMGGSSRPDHAPEPPFQYPLP